MDGRYKIVNTARSATGREVWLWLVLFVSAGIALRVGAAILLPTIERPDEVFQNLEPAHRLWAGTGVVSWEWRVGIRSWLFPAMLAGLVSAAGHLGLPDGTALPLIWTALACVSAGVSVAGVGLGWRRFGRTGALLCGLLTAFWPDLVYYGPKTLGEVQAGNLVVVAAFLAGDPARRSRGRLFAIGFLLGAAFDLRFQLALTLLLIAGWAARAEFRRGWLPLVAGAAIPLLLLGAVDWWTLGSPFQSVWKNIQVNLLEHRAAEYGAMPIYKYVSFIVTRNGAACLAMAGLFIYGTRAAPLMALTAISVVLFHSAITHKEISFVYAALPCAIVTIGLGAARVVDGLQRWLRHPPRPARSAAAAALLTLATIVLVDLSEQPFAATPIRADLTTFYREVRGKPDLCGLGLVSTDRPFWFLSGGYSFLGRPVPIYLARSPADLAESREGFNYAIAQRASVPALSGYATLRCGAELCLLHRPEPCAASAEHEFSRELARSDM